MKKLMLLGGLRYLLPVIEEAHKLGIYVITADYLPNNIAHKYSDEYCNVSIIDKDAVLKAAQELKIDGILSHAVDPGVVSAAYVAEKMGLPFQCSYKAACILQDKSLFRKFLSENGFNCPKAKGYDNADDALKDVDFFNWPVIVKPVDSAGSKGVTKVEDKADLQKAIKFALSESHNGHFIIEDFLEKEGLSAGSESFVVNGKLLYNGFYDQYFDNEAVNPYAPSAEIWPSAKDSKYLDEIRSELQRLFTLLNITTGLFNVEWRVCKNGKAYLMEVSPRAGGNRLAEMLNYAADVNIIEAEVRKSVGLPVQEIHEPNYKGHFAIQVLHSDRAGLFERIDIDDQFRKKHLLEEEIRVSPGDKVAPFTGANASIGTLFLRFETREELENSLNNPASWMQIKLK
ncbi:MAG: ATP-grasp domain-containing protein [Fibrobacter sp.]|nr:ATP-grasp domain-containing protein [Fibrobacter sp.]MDY6389298.1 ATP-grasp domain-containing protein [Fibrobacter sp.]